MFRSVPVVDTFRDRLPATIHVLFGIGFIALFLLLPIALLVINSLNFGGELLENYRIALSDVYLRAIFNSLFIAAVSTPILLLLAFFVSYFIIFQTKRTRLMLGLVLLPMWIAYIIRYLGIQLFLYPNGPVVSVFDTNFGLLFSTTGVVLGLVSGFLPFAVLPIYNSLSGVDRDLIDASSVMGATRLNTIRHVMIPLSVPGFVTAGLLVFILSAGAFLAPDILGGPSDLMIANMIERSYSEIFDIKLAAALAVIYTTMLLTLLVVFNSYLNIGEVLSDV